MPTLTPNYDFNLPLVNDATDQDLWGGELNDNFTSLDSLLYTATNVQKRVVTGVDTATISDRNRIILGDATLASYVQTLPSAATVGNGFVIAFTKTDATANTISVTRTGSDTIGSSTSAYVLSTQNDVLTLISDGVSNWNYQSKSIPLATNAEALAGVSTTKAITPANLHYVFTIGSNITTTGFYAFPGGLILQWGQASISGTTAGAVTFPEAFPNACYNVQITPAQSLVGGTEGTQSTAYNYTTTGFTLFNSVDHVGAVNFAWVAIGS